MPRQIEPALLGLVLRTLRSFPTLFGSVQLAELPLGLRESGVTG
jgi:hypothetical protein